MTTPESQVRCLTLHQPYASLLAWGEKRIETRGHSLSYRGEMWIHAAKALPDYAWDAIFMERAIYETLRKRGVTNIAFENGVSFAGAIPMGRIVGVGRMNGSKQIREVNHLSLLFTDGTAYELTPEEKAFGWYEPGRFCWFMEGMTPLAEPVKASGSQGLWMPTPEVYAQVRQQLEPTRIKTSANVPSLVTERL
jgi:hypothetical protein